MDITFCVFWMLRFLEAMFIHIRQRVREQADTGISETSGGLFCKNPCGLGVVGIEVLFLAAVGDLTLCCLFYFGLVCWEVSVFLIFRSLGWMVLSGRR